MSVLDRFPHSTAELKRVKTVQFGVLSPDEIVRLLVFLSLNKKWWFGGGKSSDHRRPTNWWFQSAILSFSLVLSRGVLSVEQSCWSFARAVRAGETISKCSKEDFIRVAPLLRVETLLSEILSAKSHSRRTSSARISRSNSECARSIRTVF